MKKPAPKAPVKGHGGGGAAGHGGAAGGSGKGGGAGKAPAAGKHQAKAKAKPAKVSRAVHRARRQAALRGAATRKKHAATAKKRGLALGSAVACCSAEALAASLRLSGWPVSDADVLALYWHTARDEHAGASIVATLEAASIWGLAGCRPDFQEVMPGARFNSPICATRAGLILGVDLPGPHAVLDTGSEWISWGQPWPVSAFPDVVLEEAWEVTWPS